MSLVLAGSMVQKGLNPYSQGCNEEYFLRNVGVVLPSPWFGVRDATVSGWEHSVEQATASYDAHYLDSACDVAISRESTVLISRFPEASRRRRPLRTLTMRRIVNNRPFGRRDKQRTGPSSWIADRAHPVHSVTPIPPGHLAHSASWRGVWRGAGLGCAQRVLAVVMAWRWTATTVARSPNGLRGQGRWPSPIPHA